VVRAEAETCGATTEAVKSDRNSSSETTTLPSEEGKATTVLGPVKEAASQTAHRVDDRLTQISGAANSKDAQTPRTVVEQTGVNRVATTVHDFVAQT